MACLQHPPDEKGPAASVGASSAEPLLHYFGMPPYLMRQVIGLSMALIKEYLALAEKHFPSEYDLVAYLCTRGRADAFS